MVFAASTLTVTASKMYLDAYNWLSTNRPDVPEQARGIIANYLSAIAEKQNWQAPENPWNVEDNDNEPNFENATVMVEAVKKEMTPSDETLSEVMGSVANACGWTLSK